MPLFPETFSYLDQVFSGQCIHNQNKKIRQEGWGAGGWAKGRSGVEFVDLFYTAERIKSPCFAFTFHPFAVLALLLFFFF